MLSAAMGFYDGFWKDDKPCGRGRLVLKDLTVVEGIFEDGLISRQWIDDIESNYDGLSNLNGEAHGKCIVKYKNGECYDGDWFNGRK